MHHQVRRACAVYCPAGHLSLPIGAISSCNSKILLGTNMSDRSLQFYCLAGRATGAASYCYDLLVKRPALKDQRRMVT